MLKSLSSDFYKLRKSKAFLVCTIVCVAFGIIALVAVQASFEIATSAVEALPQMLSSGNFNSIIAGVFVAIFVTSEFSHGTIKNSLSRGAGRMTVLFSKLIVCSTAIIVMQLLFIAGILVTGTVLWGFDPQNSATLGSLLRMILLQLLVMVSFTTLFTFISTAIRSNGGSIATNIICATMVPVLLSALSLLFKGRINLAEYWIDGMGAKIATFTPEPGDVLHVVLVTVIWGIASIIAASILFQRQDVK